jgi:hypothetical protein
VRLAGLIETGATPTGRLRYAGTDDRRRPVGRHKRVDFDKAVVVARDAGTGLRSNSDARHKPAQARRSQNKGVAQLNRDFL